MNFRRKLFAICASVLIATLGSARPASCQPAAPTQVAASDYVLDSEDVISISVIRHAEFSGDFFIPQTGSIQVPGVGEIKVSGRTLSDVQNQVAQELRTRLRNPEVTVTLKVARQRRIYIFGAVQNPGIQDMKAGWGVAECLSAVGGLQSGILDRDCRLIIDRREKDGSPKRIEVPLLNALNGLTEKQVAAGISMLDLQPRPGDVFRFEAVEMFSVYVNGKVKVPGAYKIRQDNSGILEVLAQAQGVAEGAAIDKVKVIHLSGTEEVADLTGYLLQDSLRGINAPANGQPTKPANPATPVALPKLEPGDMVIVPEQMDRVAVLGYVTKPGMFSIPIGRKFTLSDAVAAASGPTDRGRITRVGLVRSQNGQDIRKVFDLGRYLTKGDAGQNPELLPGDVIYVPESAQVPITSILQGIASSALFFTNIRR